MPVGIPGSPPWTRQRAGPASFSKKSPSSRCSLRGSVGRRLSYPHLSDRGWDAPMTLASTSGDTRALREARMVAIASRSAAVLLAALGVAVIGLFEIEAPAGPPGAPVVNAFIAAPLPQAQAEVVRPYAPVAEVVVSVAPAEGDAEWPHLWTYDTFGRIVFRSDEQLARCLSARSRGREEADCPDSSDRTPMLSSEGGRRRYSENGKLASPLR